MTNITHNA